MLSSNNNQFKVNIEDFKIIREIGRGADGDVYKVEEKKSGKRYAAKVIRESNAEQNQETINREIQIMMRITHPTLIGLRGYSTTDFSGKKNITIFMELAEKGSLKDILENARRRGNYDNTTRQIILVGIAYGMMTLHQNHIFHRDLKPGNILIDKNFYPHIADFGHSKFVNPDHSESQSKPCGTTIYMAPEVINGNHCDIKADVYSFGIIMFQILTDEIPYPLLCSGELTIFNFLKKVVEENYRPSFTVPVKKQMKKLIELCWSKEPKDRPTFKEIFNKLAYNRECSNYDEEEKNDDTPYYLSDVDVDELFTYLDIITDNAKIIGELSKTVKNQQEIITKMQNEIKHFKDQKKQFKEKIENQDKLIKQQNAIIKNQNNRIDELEKKLHELKNKISINILCNFNKYFMQFQQIFYAISVNIL